MATVTLILSLEETTLNNPSDSRIDSRIDSRGNNGAAAQVTAAAADRQRSDNGTTAVAKVE